MKNRYLALCASLMFCASPAQAATQQSHTLIRDAALAYAQKQTESLPGKVSVKIEEIDKRTVLRACSTLEAFQPSGAQLIGKTSIGVRCNDQPGWSVFLQTTIRVNTTLLVAKRPLAQNTLLKSDDFTLQSGELGQPGILTDPAQAIGKTLKFGIGAGQILRQDMLRVPYVVAQGQTTEVRVHGEGFAVRSSGQALNNGSEGQNVQVRMASGQVITGSATAEGYVEVRQ